jgi:hypothetical protein
LNRTPTATWQQGTAADRLPRALVTCEVVYAGFADPVFFRGGFMASADSAFANRGHAGRIFSGPVSATIGRILLLLTAISLVTMPVTERIWTWDHFAQGGRDFELSMILVLSFFCLVLVLSKHGKQCIDLFFASWRRLAHVVSPSRSFVASVGSTYTRNSELAPRPGLSMRNLPLQI